MFTGLVECTGKVLERTPVASGARYAVEIPFAAGIYVPEVFVSRDDILLI